MSNKLMGFIAILTISAIGTVSAQENTINWDGTLTNSISIKELVKDAPPRQFDAQAVKAAQADEKGPQEKYTVLMEDKVNNIRAELSVTTSHKNGGIEFAVLNVTGPGGIFDGTTVRILTKGMNTPIKVDAGVPHLTPARILAIYGADVRELLSSGKLVSESGQLTWTLSKNGSQDKPAELELAMIMFLVDEWFYYG